MIECPKNKIKDKTILKGQAKYEDNNYSDGDDWSFMCSYIAYVHEFENNVKIETKNISSYWSDEFWSRFVKWRIVLIKCNSCQKILLIFYWWCSLVQVCDETISRSKISLIDVVWYDENIMMFFSQKKSRILKGYDAKNKQKVCMFHQLTPTGKSGSKTKILWSVLKNRDIKNWKCSVKKIERDENWWWAPHQRTWTK